MTRAELEAAVTAAGGRLRSFTFDCGETITIEGLGLPFLRDRFTAECGDPVSAVDRAAAAIAPILAARGVVLPAAGGER